MAKRNILNVKTHLEHINLIIEGLRQYGYCGAIEYEINRASLINKAILAKHTKKNTRKDIYVNR